MELTFEQLPKAMTQVLESLERIENLLKQKVESAADPDKLLTVKEAAMFLYLSVPTIYGLTHNNTVPFYKTGKRIYFLTSDLIAWVKTGRRKTNAEIEVEAANYILKHRRK